MNSLIKFFSILRRFSTLFLMALTLIVGGYVYLTWPKSYYELYCGDADTLSEDATPIERFDTAYECDTQIIELRKQGRNRCPELGCRKIFD